MNTEDVIAYGWEDQIKNEGGEFVLLPDGDYEYTVKKVLRTRYNGSEKVPPCNRAMVTFEVAGSDGAVSIEEGFFLLSNFEWKLSQLFLSLGMKKHGEPLKMNWNIIGKRGKCKVVVETYVKKDGTEGKANRIKRFYDYDETNAPAASGWTAGRF